MSIMIKNMELPESCFQCRFCNWDSDECVATGKPMIISSNLRQDWCPLEKTEAEKEKGG